MARQTTQRKAILETFQALKRPLSVQEVLEKAGEVQPSLGVATVYRNIKRMLEDGVLRSVDLPDQVSRYELAGLAHHHHFHCQECDKVFDFHSCLKDVETLAPDGFLVQTHEIILYGLCQSCS